MTKAIIYTRFSPRRNSDESESCETQEAICRKHAEERGHTVIGVFDDPDVSGKDEYREKLWQAIEALPKGGVLLVFKRDRLARNVYLSEQINRAVSSKGAKIEAVSGDVEGDGPEHVMIRQVLAAIAEYERKLIGLRTSYAMRQHQKSGRLMSRYPPYGYAKDPADPALMIEVPSEQRAIGAIRLMHEGGMKPHAIMQHMNKSEPNLARAGRWNAKVVSKIIGRL